jgi:large subunit ribosomal protein L4
MKLEVIDIKGQGTGRSVELPGEVFGIEPNEHVIYLAVKAAQANKRQGTHASKERGNVAGSTRKIKKQKGTGTARAGDIKNPLFRGGGRIFGPNPRDYSQKVNKKVKKLARNSALSAKMALGKLQVIEDFTFEQPSTKQFAEIYSSVNPDLTKTLFLISDYDKNLYLSSRNIPNFKLLNIKDINVLDLMRAEKIYFSEGSLDFFNEKELI